MSVRPVECRIVLVTAPHGSAEKIGTQVVKKKLAACVNIVPGLTSLYWWKGKVNRDSESLLIFKTCTRGVSKLTSFIQKNHPYDVPEVISLRIEDGSHEYLQWIVDSVRR